mmetsp:Transcript_7399/g.18083  ORF Transcript_7399/g.18083 Transcript_7399/m.18083 type:complete len:237 (+) Transcript_7399:564-1274(+)
MYTPSSHPSARPFLVYTFHPSMQFHPPIPPSASPATARSALLYYQSPDVVSPRQSPLLLMCSCHICSMDDAKAASSSPRQDRNDVQRDMHFLRRVKALRRRSKSTLLRLTKVGSGGKAGGDGRLNEAFLSLIRLVSRCMLTRAKSTIRSETSARGRGSEDSTAMAWLMSFMRMSLSRMAMPDAMTDWSTTRSLSAALGGSRSSSRLADDRMASSSCSSVSLLSLSSVVASPCCCCC